MLWIKASATLIQPKPKVEINEAIKHFYLLRNPFQPLDGAIGPLWNLPGPVQGLGSVILLGFPQNRIKWDLINKLKKEVKSFVLFYLQVVSLFVEQEKKNHSLLVLQ